MEIFASDVFFFVPKVLSSINTEGTLKIYSRVYIEYPCWRLLSLIIIHDVKRDIVYRLIAQLICLEILIFLASEISLSLFFFGFLFHSRITSSSLKFNPELNSLLFFFFRQQFESQLCHIILWWYFQHLIETAHRGEHELNYFNLCKL